MTEQLLQLFIISQVHTKAARSPEDSWVGVCVCVYGVPREARRERGWGERELVD